MDLLRFDFHNPEHLQSLDLTGMERPQVLDRLKGLQRLLRIAPTEDAAMELMAAGFHSAHTIAAVSEARFLNENPGLFNGNEEQARQVHRNAVSLKAQVSHLWASVRHLVGSQHYRSTLVHNVDSKLLQYFQSIPSYQDLFGGLDYLECPSCRSIFSPAAYFVDLQRIIDEYITYPNTHKPADNIPEGMRLEDRRPDLFDLELTCGNTDTVIPFLKVVNEVLEQKIDGDSGGRAFEILALSAYPFNLPLHLPLAQIRTHLGALKTSLAEVFTLLSAPLTAGIAQGAENTNIKLASSASEVDGYYTGMEVRLTAGPGAGQRRRITAYTGATRVATVEPAWSPSPTNESHYEVTDTLDVVRERLGMSLEELKLITTPDASPVGLNRAYGYEDISAQLFSLQLGAGSITFKKGSVEVVGNGQTGFDTNLSVGDRILCNRELRSVAAITSPTTLKVDTPWDTDASSAAYQVERWFTGQGKITIQADSHIVTGDADTHFDRLAVGDAIQCAQVIRTITEIKSATELTVDATWKVSAAHAPYTINPTRMLERVSTFLARTGLTREQLSSLFEQEFSATEFREGVANRFFINDTNEALPPLHIISNQGDPDDPYLRIIGLSYKRLDRLSRFIRLQARLGWSFSNTNWLLTSIGATELTPVALEAMAVTQELATSLQLPVDVVTAFWHDVKTTGWKRDDARQDLFDRVFNSPPLLRGQNPYDTKNPPIPFDPSRPLDWNVDERTSGSQSAIIRSRLLAALAINDDDLTAVARFVLSLLGVEGSVLKLDLAHLSWLYRLVQQATASGLPVRDYLILLRLMYFPSRTLPPRNAIPADLAATPRALADAQWLRGSGFNAYELLYTLTGELSQSFQRGYTDAELRRMIQDAAAASAGARVTPASLVFNDIRIDQATTIVGALEKAGFITQLGIDRDQALSYDALAFTIPVTETSFVTQEIDVEQSKAAFHLLATHAPPILIVAEGDTSGMLSRVFDASTSLSFLFPGDPQAAAKQAAVRNILLLVKADIENTVKVLEDARSAQDALAAAGMAGFFGISTTLLYSVLRFALGVQTLGSYREHLLTPLAPTTPIPKNVETLAVALSRTSLWVARWEFTPAELDAIVAKPAPFGIQDTRQLSLADLQGLARFRKLTAQFNGEEGALLAYFETPSVERLAKLTGWSTDQLQQLIAAFWPDDSGSQGAATVDGVSRLAGAFDLVQRTGLDASFFLGLMKLLHLSVGEIGGKLIESAWKVYEQQAGSTLNALGARFHASEFTEALDKVTGQIDTLKRDSLLGYTLWSLSKKFPWLRTPADLYQFLLLDVEMSSCATTSRIAQAIASVQLYLQRARMNIEPGVTDIRVDPIWWEWLSSYRVWEANRKIFVYPESFLEPSLRSGQTPLFKEMAQALLQSSLTEGSVTNAFLSYFEGLATLANLVVTGTYNTVVPKASGDRERLYMFARGGTDPYTYYYRTHDELESWSPWEKVDLSINSPYVAPAVVFDNLFIFWAEFDTNRSSSISQASSNDRITVNATLRYSFLSVNAQWVQPQTLAEHIPIEVGPDDYAPLSNEWLKQLLDIKGLSWQQPYPLKIARGIPGTGHIDITAGLGNISGTSTLFRQEVQLGDSIYCAGETRKVVKFFPGEELYVEPPWGVSATNAEFKVLPASPRTNGFPPFQGDGTVTTTKGLQNVTGTATRFGSQISVGDRILIGSELRTVILIQSSTELLVHRAWDEDFDGKPYTIIPRAIGAEQLIVVFGSPLDSTEEIKADAPKIVPNPGRDSFIEQRQAFDFSVFYAIEMTKEARAQKIQGEVTLGFASQINSELNSRPARMVMADYGFSASDAPRPFRPILDRSEQLLRVIQSDNVLFDNYWGNSASGTTIPPFKVGAGQAHELLFNIAPYHSTLLNVGNQVGWFVFDNGDESFLVRAKQPGLGKISEMTYSRQFKLAEPDRQGLLLSAGAFTSQPLDFSKLDFEFTRISTSTIPVLRRKLLAGGIDSLHTLASQETSERSFSRFFPVPTRRPDHVIPPKSDVLDFDGAYGPYFQEIFLFVPWLVADRLQANQQFEAAQRWYQYIFNPTASPELGDHHPSDRFWRYLPFRDLSLQKLAETLQDRRQITQYNDRPFDPDAIARLRPGAYAKAVVLAYIDNLLSWGDFLFARDTRESINQATQLYVVAAELLGERPKVVGTCPVPKPLTFRQIRERYGQDVPQFLIDLENASSVLQAAPPVAYRDIPFNDIRAYFCVPDNAELIQYWDRLEDRLYKIRHCMNLQGIVRQLALFEPPLNPRELIRRTAGGQGGLPTAGVSEAPIPNYRFSFMLERAKSFTASVVQLGGALLAALEKQDAERLALLRSSQERVLLDLTTFVKGQQIQEVASTGQALMESRNSAIARRDYYQRLIAEGLSSGELSNLQAMEATLVFSVLASVATTAASIGYAVPQVGSPFAYTYGGIQIGSALQAAAGVFQIGSAISSFVAQRSLTAAGYERRAQQWQIMATVADLDEKQITAQIAANQAQQKIAERDLRIHLQNITDNQALETFLTRKFTNQQLYDWMVGQLAETYFQTYLLAFDLARSAQRALQFECNTSQSFIDFNYWDSLRKGLLAGEGLMLALNRMEKSYVDGNVRALEIERTISLLQLDPKALLTLKAMGECTFTLPERLFDSDFPGHYLRKIKSISLSIPAVFGPYQSVQATLTQLGNQVLLRPDVKGVEFLLGTSNEVPGPDTLRSNWWVNQQVALSKGVHDSGLFALDFGDPRYLPYEGTGAVSTWRLSMPPAANRFSFASISDVLIELKYTAMDGGAEFRRGVVQLAPVKEFLGSPLLIFNQQYSREWYVFLHEHPDPAAQTLRFQIAPTLIPPHVRNAKLTGFFFVLMTDSEAGSGPLPAIEQDPYLSFSVTRDVKVDFALDPRNTYFHRFDQPLSVAELFSGERTITFDLAHTPSKFKKGGYLDPDTIRNIGLVLYVQGTVDWK
ncbi:hypothetical protein HI113_03805 [Corallococcus exiguus]|uniref:Tc toxin subunit A-related protein n=1 Tax=Corallococcus exiguus TaxID=83462 RepID=UPI0014746C13|nr:neuraminidase-like domain-containing protein [Corallococcus exiguus]NNB93035.1 hypothetical protein [Corallococcus exiguus]